MYNQRNKLSLISCDQNNGRIIFCGKYYIKNKVLMIFFLSIIIGVVLIWLYNNFKMNKQ